jgi:hypothetical protein
MSTLFGATITSYRPPITAIGNNFATTTPHVSFPENPVLSSQLDQVEAGKDLTKIILIIGGVVVAGALVYYAYQYFEDQRRER